MDTITIQGVKLTPLKKIIHPQGDVLHGIKKTDDGFTEFGEAYFSTIKTGLIKPWKKHIRMTLNLIVPIGEVRFVIYDDRKYSETYKSFMDITLSINHYYRLTIPPNVWIAFEGIGDGLNLLLNVADLEHDPNEIVRLEIQDISYQWK